MMVLNSSYRSPLAFSQEVIKQAESNLDRLRAAMRPGIENDGPVPETLKIMLKEQMQATRDGFIAAMDDDFNTAGALGHVFDLVRIINQARDAHIPQKKLLPAQILLRELVEDVFGLRLERPVSDNLQAVPFIDLLVELRSQLRAEKLWALSDQVRDQLAELGILIEDSKEGTSWRWK
jgi:cysteinyl-tRNA synthetase